MSPMSDFIPKSSNGQGTGKVGGLGPKAQRLQALRDKAAGQKDGSKHADAASAPKAKALAGAKKTSFNRKAV